MAFPPGTIATNVTDATDQAGLHPQLHNQLAAGVNDLTAEAQRLNGALIAGDNALDARLDVVETATGSLDTRMHNAELQLEDIYGDIAHAGIIRDRTNIDAVSDGGSVRYTVAVYDDFSLVDVGDGSGFRVSRADIYAVSASTIPDGGADLTCYLNVGSRSVAVGSRLLPDGSATLLTWVGRCLVNEVISVHVRMPVPRAVVGGRLEIWRVANST